MEERGLRLGGLADGCEVGFFDIVFTLFFIMGALVPSLFIRAAYIKSKLLTALKNEGKSASATCRGKRAALHRSGKHGTRTAYYVLITFPLTDIESYQCEVAVDGYQYSAAVENTTLYNIAYLDRDPSVCAFKTALTGGVGIQNFLCTPAAAMILTFMLFWNVMILIFPPWCYAPFWAYPIGGAIPWVCKCKIGAGSVTHGNYGRVLTADLGAQQASAAPLLPVATALPVAAPVVIAPASLPGGESKQGTSLADEMQKLFDLKMQGALTEAEFAEAKRQLMNK